MTCSLNYYVRVPDTSKVLLYTAPTPTNTAPVSSSPVNEIPFAGGATICVSEDPNSTVKKLRIDMDQCPNCTLPATWQNQVMSIAAHAPSIGSGGGVFLLKVQPNGTGPWYYAANNPPGIDGGRPIIRNQFGSGIIYVAIALVAFGVIYMFAKWWNSSHPSGP